MTSYSGGGEEEDEVPVLEINQVLGNIIEQL